VQYFKLFSIYNSNIVFQKCITTKQWICKCTWNFQVTNIYFNFFSARPLGPPWLRHCSTQPAICFCPISSNL